MKSKIAVIGTTFVDCKGFVDGLSGAYNAFGRNTGTVKFVHGGVARNVAENLAGMGDAVYFASSVDESGLAEEVKKRLAEKGASVEYVTTGKDHAMGIWMVILDVHGEQVGSLSYMPDTAWVEDMLEERGEDMLRQVDYIAAEIDMSEKIAAWTVKMAAKYEKPLFAITGNLNILLEHPEYLPAFSCFVCNEIEIGKIFHFEAKGLPEDILLDILAEEMKKRGMNRLVVTIGSRGAVYVDISKGLSGHVPCIKTEVKDVSGAGDAFFSGTIHALMQGKTLGEAVEIGTKLASLTIQNDENCCAAILNGEPLPWA